MFRGKGLIRLERLTEVLRDLAGQHGKTPSQVALRWLLRQHSVLPIPGAKNGRQAADNAGALSVLLSESEMDTLSRVTPHPG